MPLHTQFPISFFKNTYVTLPQYLTPDLPALLEDYDVTAQWTPLASTATREANTAQVKSGSQSIKLTNATSGSSGTMEKISTLNLSNVAAFRLWLYTHSPETFGGITIYFGQNSFAQFFSGNVSSYLNSIGWHAIQVLPSSFNNTGGGNWSLPFDKYRMRITPVSAQVTNVSWDKLETVDVKPKPAVVITFDDGWSSSYDGFTYLRARRVCATHYIITNNINGAGRLTDAQLREMDAAGHDIANHTMSHTNLTTLNEMEQEAELSGAAAALDALGLTRANHHVSYPYGGYNDDTFAAMAATGMITGRCTRPGYELVPPSDNYTIKELALTSLISLATAKAYVDGAVSNGSVLVLLFHSLVATTPTPGSNEWAISDFQALVDYVIEKRIQPLTITQFHALQNGQVTVVQPW